MRIESAILCAHVEEDLEQNRVNALGLGTNAVVVVPPETRRISLVVVVAMAPHTVGERHEIQAAVVGPDRTPAGGVSQTFIVDAEGIDDRLPDGYEIQQVLVLNLEVDVARLGLHEIYLMEVGGRKDPPLHGPLRLYAVAPK